MTESGEYVLGSTQAERERLLAQCRIYEPETRWLLDRVGIVAGWRAVDIGCGPLGILDLLSGRVGPVGAVVGLERDPRMLDWARLSVAERNLTNVQLIDGDAGRPPSGGRPSIWPTRDSCSSMYPNRSASCPRWWRLFARVAS